MRRRKITMTVAAVLAFAAGFLSTAGSAPAPRSPEVKPPPHIASAQAVSDRAAPGS